MCVCVCPVQYLGLQNLAALSGKEIIVGSTCMLTARDFVLEVCVICNLFKLLCVVIALCFRCVGFRWFGACLQVFLLRSSVCLRFGLRVCLFLVCFPCMHLSPHPVCVPTDRRDRSPA